jgi:hypothetical protein
VDQNLGHAHLLYTLLLYGRYVDPSYLRRPGVRARIEELIRFQWLSQDWNGDIWRVYVGGYDAGGSGDGYEEDLAMVLPRLAEMAGLDPEWRALAARVAAMKYGALRQFDYLPVDNEWGLEFLTPMHHPTEWTPESGWNRDYVGDVWYSGPATCGGIYGPWYIDNVYRGREDAIRHMWYDLIEDPRDVTAADARHWLTVGGYCTEAGLTDPFLGAVKLLRSYDVAVEHDFLTPRTQGENIWNFAFYPAAMTAINEEIVRRYPWMKDARSVAGAAISPDRDHLPAYAWKIANGAVVSVAAYRVQETQEVEIRINGAALGLTGAAWRIRDLKGGQVRRVASGTPITATVAPRSATTFVITPATAP